MQSKATVSYPGGKQNYTFPFPYLSRSFVKVRYESDRGATQLTYYRDYHIEGQTVLLNSPAPTDVTVYVYRKTPTNSLVDFNDGSLLLAREMDKIAMQLLHVEEENTDILLTSAMVTDEDSAWQGRGRRLKNLRDPQQPQDAVTLHYLDGVGVARQDELQRIEQAVHADKESALSFKNDAASSAQSASTSASNSAQSAAASERSRQASAESESKIKNMQVDVHAMQQHVDEVKTAIDGVAARAKADGQTASDAAVQAQRSAGASAQSATASEASAKRAEAAAKFEGVIKSENLSEKSVRKQHLSFEVYDKAEVDGCVNAKVNKSGDTMTGTLNFANNVGTCLFGVMANNDAWRICAGNAGSNVGYLALDTCDDGAEEICVRQFTGNFQNQVRVAQLLRQDGATTFPVSVSAPTFYANDWFRAKGSSGFYFQDHGGGWQMTDDTWIRAHGGKGVYTSGKMKADGGFEGALHGRADSAGNSDTLGGQSLQWIINQINAAKTGIVAGNLTQNGWVKFANGLIVQWGAIRNYEYNVFPIAHTQWVHVFLVAGISGKTPEDRSTTYGATLVGEPMLTKFYPLVGNTEYEGGVSDKTGVGRWVSIGV